MGALRTALRFVAYTLPFAPFFSLSQINMKPPCPCLNIFMNNNFEHIHGHLGDVESMVKVNTMYRGRGRQKIARMFVFEKGWNSFYDG